MEELDIQLRVADHASLDSETKASLMSTAAIKPLPLSDREKLFGNVPSGNKFFADIESTGVMVTDDWLVLIRGRQLLHTVAAMTVLVNSLQEVLKSPVSIDISVVHNRNEGSIGEALRKQARRDRWFTPIKQSATILISLIVGAIIDRMILEVW